MRDTLNDCDRVVGSLVIGNWWASVDDGSLQLHLKEYATRANKI